MTLKNFCVLDTATGDWMPADTCHLLDLSKLNDSESLDFAEGESWDRINLTNRYGVNLEELEYHTVMEDHRNFHLNEDDARNLLIFIHQHADSNSYSWEIADRLRAHLKTTVS